MLEPSKPKPSVKMSSLYSLRVVVKCCQVPRRSVNLKSISLIPLSLIKEVTSAGVINDAMVDDGLRLRGFNQGFGIRQSTGRRFDWRRLKRPIPAFFRSYADNLQEILDKNFAVASCSGPCALLYCSNGRT
jgi:hypothetical protein